MIINGNYKYLDFEANKQKIIDIMLSVYGAENEDNITERMNKVEYVPYTKYECVIDYYSQSMNKYKDEIYKKFEEISGIRLFKLSKDIVWKDGGSKLFLAIMEGENLDSCECLLTKETCDEIRKARKYVCQVFGINENNAVAEIQKLCRYTRQALDEVAKAHPNDVNRDVQKFISNKNELIQKYLLYINKYYMNLTKRDMDILNNPDFDTYDVENLDCRYMFFELGLSSPGLISYFSTANEEILENGTIDQQIDIMEGRVRWFAFNDGPETLKCVTPEEIFSKVEVKDKKDYLKRLMKELDYQKLAQPEMIIECKTADNIEAYRRILSDMQFMGCKFAASLNRNYNGQSHSSISDMEWFTTMEYDGGTINAPINKIFFNEDTRLSPDSLTQTLIHECTHAISFGDAFISRSKKKAFGNFGFAGRLYDIEKDNRIVKEIEYNDYDYIINVEENQTEKEANETYNNFRLYFEPLFEPCDIEPEYYSDDRESLYDYWNILTSKFYEYYGSKIKESRVTNKKIFFDNDGVPSSNVFERTIDYVRHHAQNIVDPEGHEKYGFLSYNKVLKLGKVIEDFKNDVLPVLVEENVPAIEVTQKSGPHYDELDESIKLAIAEYEAKANSVVDSMIKDSANEISRSIDRAVLKKNVKSVLNTVTKPVRDVTDFIKGKNNKKKKVTDKTDENIQKKDDGRDGNS